MVSAADLPIFSAVSGSARQLFLLLRCIGFARKATVQISDDGLRFIAEDSNVMEATVFLDKSLFTTYRYEPPAEAAENNGDGGGDDENPAIPPFEISLTALLEMLQLFGVTETSKTSTDPVASIGAFDPRSLGLNCVCRFAYSHVNAPLTVSISEGNISTTASLNAYEPLRTVDIPFDRQALLLKVIMKSAPLSDAIAELSGTSPTRLSVAGTNRAGPSLALTAVNDGGSTIVSFGAAGPDTRGDSAAAAAAAATVVETFQLPRGPVRQDYKFSLVKQADRAMAMATKLSLRIDEQGVMNMQFMIELDAAGTGPNGRVAFVDFRFVPFLSDGQQPDEDEGEEEDAAGTAPADRQLPDGTNRWGDSEEEL